MSRESARCHFNPQNWLMFRVCLYYFEFEFRPPDLALTTKGRT